MGDSVNFLAPLLTDTALQSVRADPSPVITLLLVIIGIAVEITLAWFIHFKTRIPVPKGNGGKGGGGKGGAAARGKILGLIPKPWKN